MLYFQNSNQDDFKQRLDAMEMQLSLGDKSVNQKLYLLIKEI